MKIKEETYYEGINRLNASVGKNIALIDDNTGKNFNTEFGAFVYGPKTTFLSVIPKSNWIQINNKEN